MRVCIYKRFTPGTRDKKYVYRERENNGVVVVIEEKEEEFFEKVQTKKKAKKMCEIGRLDMIPQIYR